MERPCVTVSCPDSLQRKASHSIVICVSPLIEVMLNQRAKYTPRDLSTEMIGVAQEDVDVLQRVYDGKYQLKPVGRVYTGVIPCLHVRNLHYINACLLIAYFTPSHPLNICAGMLAHCTAKFKPIAQTTFRRVIT